MGIPLNQALSVGAYVLRQHLKGRARYPLVLMLEPLFRCNLACAGCGKIDYPEKILNQRLSIADCMEAIDECGAPVVVLAGGEPLLHKELPQIVAGALAKRKFVTVCTNALLMDKKLHQYRPHRRFNWSVHLDGDREMHDRSVCQQGVYEKAVAAIRNAKAKGFRVNINCTLFNDAEPERVAGFFDDVKALGVDGITVSPGYAYERAPDQQHFLNRTKTKQLFRDIFRRAPRSGKHGRSFSRRCSSISWRAIRAISARLGATRREQCSAGSGPVTYSVKVMPRPSRSSWKRPTGKAYGTGATRNAPIAWFTAASKRPPSRMPSRSLGKWRHWRSPA